jgi:hypothetical protein
VGVDLDEDPTCSVDIHLQETCFIKRGVKEGEKALDHGQLPMAPIMWHENHT